MFDAFARSRFNHNDFRVYSRTWEAQQQELFGDPLFCIFGRHGESVGNIVNGYVKRNRLDQCPADLLQLAQSVHGSRYPLSELGKQQAVAMDEWFTHYFPFEFDYVYGSTHLRAKETAYLSIRSRLQAGMSKRRIQFLPWRSERNWGVFEKFNPQHLGSYVTFRNTLTDDPLHVTPELGENLTTLANRAVYPMKALLRERHSKQIIYCPGHGEVNWMERYVHEHMGEERFMELERSKDPRDKIHNGSLLIYTSMDPVTGEVSKFFTHWCMIVPWKPEYNIPWTKIDFHAATERTINDLEMSLTIPTQSIFVPMT